MLSAVELLKLTGMTGQRTVQNTQTDVLLTYLLQLFEERGVANQMVFKGGTMLRKMVFGPAGRLSTDLDFTAAPTADRDELSLKLRESFEEPYHGIAFAVDDAKNWYETPDGCSVVPNCSHAANPAGELIKIQVSFRERPILEPAPLPQLLPPEYLKLIREFAPTRVTCLHQEEVIAEKIRAGHERAQIRDLYDLHQIGRRPFNQALVRALAAAKLWSSGKAIGLDYDAFKRSIENGRGYDPADLARLLPRNLKLDLPTMIANVVTNFRFLGERTALESTVAEDRKQRDPEAYEALLVQIAAMA
jgi:predicted nucleotidyltransferase component of viral defense system